MNAINTVIMPQVIMMREIQRRAPHRSTIKAPGISSRK